MKNYKKLSLIVGVLAMSLVTGYLAFAWSEPTALPPASNVAAPLNSSINAQSKEGALVLGTNSGIPGAGLIVQHGNVGIGTTSPGIDLAIGDSDTGLQQQGDGMLAIYTNNGERVRVTSAGNVGIGTTSPGAKLDVAGNLRGAGNLTLNSASPTVYFQDTDHYSGMIHMNSHLMYILSGSGVNSATWTKHGSYWPLTVNMTNDALTFGGAAHFMEGNVGIGTTSPGAKLHVAGNIIASNPTAANHVATKEYVDAASGGTSCAFISVGTICGDGANNYCGATDLTNHKACILSGYNYGLGYTEKSEKYYPVYTFTGSGWDYCYDSTWGCNRLIYVFCCE